MTDVITAADIQRCNRLRGYSARTCSCRTGPDTPENHAGWTECPPGARRVLTPKFIVELHQATPTAIARIRSSIVYTGEVCEDCGSMEMVRTGACSTCQNCGGTGGCA